MYISYFVNAYCTLNHLSLLDRLKITVVIQYNWRKIVLFSIVRNLTSAPVVLHCLSISDSVKQRPSSESHSPHFHNTSHTSPIT